jgi:ABC-2 type transport system permease protein
VLVALTLWKEIRRQFRTPHRIVIWLALPVVLTTIMGLAFGGGRSGVRVSLAVADEDSGWLGRLLGVSIEAATNDFLETRMMARENAEKSLRTTRDLAGMVVIPKGAADALLKGDPTEFVWTPNPRMIVYPAVAYESLKQILEMTAGFGSLFREPVSLIREDAETGRPRRDGRRIAEAFRTRFESLGKAWFPPAVTLNVERPPKPARESPALFDIFRTAFPPLIMYSLFFVCQGLMRSLIRERKDGTLARVLASPVAFPRYYLATQFAFVAFALLIFGVLLVFGILAYRLVPVHPGLAFLSVLASVWCFLAFVGLLYGLARTERGGGAFAELFGTVLALIGGVFFPIPADSGILSRLSELSFFGWGARALSFAINADATLGPRFADNVVRLVITGTIFAVIAALTLRRRLVSGTARVYA